MTGIERMAHEAGIQQDGEWFYSTEGGADCDVSLEALTRFAELVRADERERLTPAIEAAANAMSLLTPLGICNDAHHAKSDRHGAGENCPVATRYIAAYHDLRAAIRSTKPQ